MLVSPPRADRNIKEVPILQFLGEDVLRVDDRGVRESRPRAHLFEVLGHLCRDDHGCPAGGLDFAGEGGEFFDVGYAKGAPVATVVLQGLE